MYVNKSSGAQGYNLDNADSSRQSIGGVYKSNENISLVNKNITGLTEVSNGTLLLDNCWVKCSNGNVCVSEVLARSNNGMLNIINKSFIEGSVECKNGKVSINDSVIKGDLKNTNGYIILRAVSGRNIITTNGNVELYQSTVYSVNNANGKVVLNESTVTGDVNVSNGTFHIKNSKVQGKLQLSGQRLTLGSGSEVNKLKLMHMKAVLPSEISSLYRGVNITSWGGVTINGIGYNNSELTRRRDVDKVEDIVTQHVRLEHGARLNHLEFTGEKCTLILEGTAEYRGGLRKD